MSDLDSQRARREIDNLGRRIERKIRELRENGELSEAHKVYLTDAEEKRAKIEQKIVAAIQEGRTMEILKDEAIRDYGAILDDLGQFIERIDSQLMKANKNLL